MGIVGYKANFGKNIVCGLISDVDSIRILIRPEIFSVKGLLYGGFCGQEVPKPEMYKQTIVLGLS